MIDYTTSTPNIYWYVLDGHGDVVALVDKNGNTVVEYSYDAWGNITREVNNSIFTGDGIQLSKANPFRYAGYFYDIEKN